MLVNRDITGMGSSLDCAGDIESCLLADTPDGEDIATGIWYVVRSLGSFVLT